MVNILRKGNLKFRILFISLIGLVNISFAQPDLILTSAGFSPLTANSGDLINFTIYVQNNGSVSPFTHLSLNISTTQDTTGQSRWSTVCVSIPPLNTAQIDTIRCMMIVPYMISSGNYYIVYSLDNRNEAGCKKTSHDAYMLTINQTSSNPQQNIPYPIIFIHGLMDSGTCWDENKGGGVKGYTTFFNDRGWSFGGTMDFCLNADSNLYTSNISDTTKPIDFKDFTDESNLQKSDYYFVNFDVNTDGSQGGYESNQSAIVKQGKAIAYAVWHVLNVTGKDKVILAGHSMGGLAAREYLENWVQPDGLKHVAKLFTTGTPHGGTILEVPFYPNVIDWQTEAIRDLRFNYDTGDSGVYLFSGIEDPNKVSQLNNPNPFQYYNVDINCNGRIYDSIIGLDNRKTNGMPSDIAYSCVIGTGQTEPIYGAVGDGCVNEWSATLNSTMVNLKAPADTFMAYGNFGSVIPYNIKDILHIHLPNSDYGEHNTRGLDEPDNMNLAYQVDTGQLYFGTITKASNFNYYSHVDWDYYKFQLPKVAGTLTLNIFNIPVSDFSATIFRLPKDVCCGNFSPATVSSKGYASISQNYVITSGEAMTDSSVHYIVISGMPDYLSWMYPYSFSLTFQPLSTVGILENKLNDMINIYPNPNNGNFTIKIDDELQNKNMDFEIYNSLGDLVWKFGQQKFSSDVVNIYLSQQTEGIYLALIKTENGVIVKKLIIQSNH